MNQEILSSNRDALAYSTSIADKLSDISGSFLDTYGLKMFTYVRSFYKGERLYISTQKDWVEHYINNEFHNDIKHLDHYLPPEGIGCALWSGFENDRVFSALHDFDLWNGFTIYERHKNYIDLFDFCTKRENTQAPNFFVNNKALLNKFIHNFKLQASDIVDDSDSRKLIVMDKSISRGKRDYTSYVDAKKTDDFMTMLKRDVSPTH